MKRKIRVGVLGLGRAGRFMHLPELALYPEDFELVAGCDSAPERRMEVPTELKGRPIYADGAELIADPNVELVTIAVRNDDHVPYALQVLEAGKYAVVEKPIAVSEEQCKILERADQKYPGKLFFRQNRRFEAGFNAVRRILSTGILGDISMIKIYRHPGFVRRLDWQTLTEFHGGLLNNWGPHMVDQALQLLESEVEDLWCNLQHRVAAGDADDQIKILMKAKNGRVADIEISGTCALPGRLYEIWGNRGSLFVPLDEKTVHLRYLDPNQKLPEIDAVRGVFPLKYGNPWEMLNFIEEDREIPSLGGHLLQRGRVLNAAEAVNPANGYTHPDVMWAYLYDAIINKVPFPVTTRQALTTMRTILRCHEIACVS